MKNKDIKKIKKETKDNNIKINIKGATNPIIKKLVEFKLSKKKITFEDLL